MPMGESSVFTINIDGGARGNPGPAAYAFVIVRDGQPPVEAAGCLGEATNNVAEYTALIKALERAIELGGKRLVIRSDSELLVKQMNGQYRVKNPQLRVLHEQANRLTDQFASVTIRHVPREENTHADRLYNEALDAKSRSSTGRVTPHSKQAQSQSSSKAKAAQEEALDCLKAAAGAWARGDAKNPPPEMVWEQLWSILQETNMLR
jgi:ribonuclease HI